MIWKYRLLTKLDPLVTAYQAELEARVFQVDMGKQEQQLDNELDDLPAILTALKDLAAETRDPTEVLEPLRLKGVPQDDLFVFRRPGIGCKIVYQRDILVPAAKPIWVYHVNNQKARLRDLADLLKKTDPAG